MNKRINLVSTIIGGRGTGKTTFMKAMIQYYLDRGIKVLIVDSYDHPSYRDVPTLQTKNLKYWKSGCYRMFGSNFKEMFQAINQHLWNAVIIFEDAFKYLKKQLDEDVIAFVIDSKGKNLDIFFMYHAWGWVPLDLFRISDVLEIFKTKDTPEVRKTAIGNFIEVKEVFDQVASDPSQYAHRSIQISA